MAYRTILCTLVESAWMHQCTARRCTIPFSRVTYGSSCETMDVLARPLFSAVREAPISKDW